jgi:hypothetical protein
MFQTNLYKNENRHNRRHRTNWDGGSETGPRSQSQRHSSCQVGANCCYWRKVIFLFLLLVEIEQVLSLLFCADTKTVAKLIGLKINNLVPVHSPLTKQKDVNLYSLPLTF